MVLKCRHNHLKATRRAFVASFKKRKFEVNSLLISNQYEIDDNKLSTNNMSDMEDDSWTWFWNGSANESDSDFEKGDDNDINNEDLEKKHSKTKKEASRKVLK